MVGVGQADLNGFRWYEIYLKTWLGSYRKDYEEMLIAYFIIMCNDCSMPSYRKARAIRKLIESL